MTNRDLGFISELERIIQERLQNPSGDSYTAKLAADGTQRIAQKVGEEGVELALAAVTGDRTEIVDEAADLVYHLLVLLADRDMSLSDVAERLRSRHAAANQKAAEPG